MLKHLLIHPKINEILGRAGQYVVVNPAVPGLSETFFTGRCRPIESPEGEIQGNHRPQRQRQGDQPE